MTCIDNFSGAVADLPKGRRTPMDVLGVLARHSRVSTWDMDATWLHRCITELERDGLIAESGSEAYPWLRYALTDAGWQVLKETT